MLQWLALVAVAVAAGYVSVAEAQQYDSSKDFDTLSGACNTAPYGIWSDDTTMWVADTVDGKIYAYKMSDKSRDTYKDFDTLSGACNTAPYGIWSDDTTTMWVADPDDDKIYAYRMLAVPPPPPTTDCRVFVLKVGPLGPGECLWTSPYSVHTTTGSTTTGLLPPSDTTPPTVVSVERTGNVTTTDRALTWNVTFSEPVVIRPDVHANHTSVANATIPDLGAVRDTILVDVPGR